MQFPMIHLNGSDAQSLMDQYAAAEGALREAINAVQAIDCNSRDYYPIGADAASVAMGEKRARLQALERIRAEMEAHALHIDDQITARAARRQPATA